jgi:hypothetical protein
MLLTAYENISNVEKRLATSDQLPRMVSFPGNLMFFKDFVFRSWHYILAMPKHRFYMFRHLAICGGKIKRGLDILRKAQLRAHSLPLLCTADE